MDSKGASAENAVGQILRDLRNMGHYGNLRVKMDQESSITDLFKAVAKERGDAKTVIEHAPRSDSKGNGQAEKAVQSIEEIVRALLIDLEQRCGENLSVNDDFFPWLLEHACGLLNRFKVRKGNRTAWERIKGKPYTGEIYAFGTPVMHRMSGPVQGGVCPRGGSMEHGSDCSSPQGSIWWPPPMGELSVLERSTRDQTRSGSLEKR